MAFAYPIDSTVTYDSAGVPTYDRAVNSEQLRSIYNLFMTNGVFLKNSNNLQVTPSSGQMQTIVKAGACIINGSMKIFENDTTLVHQASTSLDRIDSVVVRLNLNMAVRDIGLYVKEGTPATTPTAPELTRDSSVWELRLANVFIVKNSTTISAQRITDTRLNTSDCGIVSAVSQFDTTTLFDQLQDQVDENIALIQSAIDGTTAGMLQTEIEKRVSLDARTSLINKDLNEVKDAGSYVAELKDNVKTLANCPTENPFILDCFYMYGTRRILQRIIDSNSDVYMRVFDVITWSEWTKSVSTSDIINDLTSTDTDKPLAALQGKELNDKSERIKSHINLLSYAVDSISKVATIAANKATTVTFANFFTASAPEGTDLSKVRIMSVQVLLAESQYANSGYVLPYIYNGTPTTYVQGSASYNSANDTMKISIQNNTAAWTNYNVRISVTYRIAS